MAKTTTSFEDFKLNRQILKAIEEEGYQKPTEVQQKTIPLITAGHDVMSVAQTGTGKTAAFVLPILMKIKYHQDPGPRALLLAPTRELVIQIRDQVMKFTTYLDIQFVAIYGGSGPKLQRESLENGVDILIATPGRFMDFYKEQLFPTKYIKILVLDECDKMMDMGFMPQLRSILEIIPVKRQNLLFSATVPEKVLKLSEEFLEFPEIIKVTPREVAAETVEQTVFKVPNLKTKINLLQHLIEEYSKNGALTKAIIFVKSKVNANNIFKFALRKITKEIRVIHGNKDQNSRINAMRDFSDGDLKILIATDVVARGIDISNVSHVINFDVPIIYEDYVHRIGRTGRAENTGKAITFVNPAEEYHLKKIEKFIRKPIPIMPVPSKVEIIATEKQEKIEQAREIDKQKKAENPLFKGAFHEKKQKFQKNISKKKRFKRRK